MTQRYAVIGQGSIGKRHLNNLRALFPDAVIYSVSASGRSPTILAAASHCLNHTQELPDSLNGVIIASPASMHLLHVQAVIEKTKHLLIEKPIASSLADALQIEQLCQQHDIKTLVGYCLRFLSSSQFIKQALAQHRFGKIYSVQASVGQHLATWRNDKSYNTSVSAQAKLGGGVLLELSHELDYLAWLFGELDFHGGVIQQSNLLETDVEEIADIFLSHQHTAISLHLDFIQQQTERYCHLITDQGKVCWNLLTNSVELLGEQSQVLFAEPDWDRNQMYMAQLNAIFGQHHTKDSAQLSQARQTLALVETIKSKAIRR
ncbi:Gfo/Idh/MocA family oxidoreductase [Thalassotalea sp. LPB0316]|uniref:Gfo/Idh/MocA family protein n=1 Tax=Thalassotalea sp. LPB0316 TaxID=2769490 RepID=UPI0018680896|nr:Gfo/Idh/MocA family oxidoreductase [Thalassotalea sp. LPB0316]QOL27084.1 Gfo/Idh/MocA family oxidoreductase [Thalassotalea sp. LPB0316]